MRTEAYGGKNMRINLETERLILQNLTPDDYQAVFRWCGDPDVA